MRYRQMTAEGDYVFGAGSRFLANSPETVAQAVRTRLRLFAGEWFLDDRVGLALDQILGYGTQATRDLEVQARISDTQGVRGILEYSSRVDGRAYHVAATIDTIYGAVTINEVL